MSFLGMLRHLIDVFVVHLNRLQANTSMNNRLYMKVIKHVALVKC